METYIAIAPGGLEEVVKQELIDFGAENVKILHRAVEFDGDEKLLYKANMGLRTAIRILVPVARERVRDQNELYRVIKAINWTRWFEVDKTLALFSTVSNAPEFNNDFFVSLKAKDAIVDQFRELKGVRPTIDKENPDVRIYIHLAGDDCSISIDTSGESLHKRGYRKAGHLAPLSEVLAAGLILLSGWDQKEPFLDPMCGSGTIIIEAAMLAAGIAPNLKREQFGMFNLKMFDQKTWDRAWLELKVLQKKEIDTVIMGSDKSPSALAAARINIEAAGVDDFVRVSKTAFEDRNPPKEKGIIICNPPYGERLNPQTVYDLYKSVGSQLKYHYSGFNAWFLSSNIKALKQLGLRPSVKHIIFNGPLECQYAKYEMYRGSREEEAK